VQARRRDRGHKHHLDGPRTYSDEKQSGSWIRTALTVIVGLGVSIVRPGSEDPKPEKKSRERRPYIPFSSVGMHRATSCDAFASL
jgi:hypothetical protein